MPGGARAEHAGKSADGAAGSQRSPSKRSLDGSAARKQRSAFLYDSSAGPLATICRCGYSVVPVVVLSLDFWILASFHLLVNVCFKYGWWPGSRSELGQYLGLEWNDVKVITALTTFFEVFYTNQCFTRYQDLYKLTCKLLLLAQQFALELRLVLLEAHPRYARVALRYFLGALLLHLDEHVQPGVAKEIGIGNRLLTQEERAYLNQLPNGRSLVVMHWASAVFLLGAKEAALPPATQKSVITKIEQEYTAMVKLSDTLSLPVPSQYYHLLCLMVVVCVLSWGFVMGASHGIWGLLVFLVAELIFIGMIQLASDMSDPFGDDAVDFPLPDWLAECFSSCAKILECDAFVSGDQSWEARLSSEQRLDLGIEFDNGSGRWLMGSSGYDFTSCTPRADDRVFRERDSDDDTLESD